MKYRLGNSSCGSETMDKYKLYPEPVHFSFNLRPYKECMGDIRSIARFNYDSGKLEDEFEGISKDINYVFANKVIEEKDTGYIDPSDAEARKNAGFK
jgi:hypothetical protein